MLELWFDKEAGFWEEALPLGNGRIGAMVWSGVSTERISLNEDSLWSGFPQDHNIEGAADHYKKARDLAMEGKYIEAQEIVEQHTLSHYTQSYLPLGELMLHFKSAGDTDKYRRSLDLETAASKLTYSQGGAAYTRESFVSAADQAFVMRISCDKPGNISFAAQISSQLYSKTTAYDGCLCVEGIAPSEVRPSYIGSDNPVVYEEEPEKRGMKFMALAHIEARGGVTQTEGGTVYVCGADSVVIRLCTRTSFNGPFKQPYLEGAAYIDNCRNDLDAIKSKSYQAMLDDHISDYKKLFDRVKIDFGPGISELPLPKRLDNWDSSENDPALFALLFQYGRYLLISASRPGTLPANLQGIWNQHLRAPWSGNFTININTEMNYWPAEVVNLSECHEPLLTYLESLRQTGAKTAQVHYGARGFTSHHNSDIWALSNPVGERTKGFALFAFWPMSGGWLSAHAFEHYLYTEDKKFLAEKGWPVIRDAARFYLDVMIEDTDGTLIFAPSTSPENHFIYQGTGCPVSKTTTMTNAIIKETLTNAVRCCEILGIDDDFRAEAEAALAKLPGYKIGSRGELLEWSEELPEGEPAHRHTSHLYPLHPGYEINPDDTPELAEACKRTLELRGDEGTGWALAWRINFWARLGDGEHAFTLLKKQIRPVAGNFTDYSGRGGCYPNLFGAHPPFQIDSNFGACAGIAEMLLQCRGSELFILLPALPKALNSGSVSGLRAKGGVTVGIEFKDGSVVKASFTLDKHLQGRTAGVRYNGKETSIVLIPGESVSVN